MDFHYTLVELGNKFGWALEKALADNQTEDTKQEAWEELTDVFDELLGIIEDVALSR